jgi:hypothetical protein
MSPWLRQGWFRRAVLALVIGTFLPVASATVACQIHCAFADLAVTVPSAESDRGNNDHAWSGTNASEMMHPGSHLQHAGPCHLAVVPGVAAAAMSYSPLLVLDPWSSDGAATPASHVPPPPEHRPRS